MLRDGEPCKHPGCLSHLSHPCEGCGRIGGRHMATNGTPQSSEWLTLDKLKALIDTVEVPKTPPYYRCHPETYETLKRLIPELLDDKEFRKLWFVCIRIEQDVTVPLGEVLPPEGWEP